MEPSQKAKDIKQKQQGIERSLHLLILSAKSEHYQAFLGNEPTESLADICFSANIRRSHFEHKLAMITESTVQLLEALDAFTAILFQLRSLVENFLKTELDEVALYPGFLTKFEKIGVKTATLYIW